MTREEDLERIRHQTMQKHTFEGPGPYCTAMLPSRPLGSVNTGFITMTTQCGYPRDAHP